MQAFYAANLLERGHHPWRLRLFEAGRAPMVEAQVALLDQVEDDGCTEYAQGDADRAADRRDDERKR